MAPNRPLTTSRPSPVGHVAFPPGTGPAAGHTRPFIVDQDVAEFIRTTLRSLHLRAAREPIAYPDEDGCFPSSFGFRLPRWIIGNRIVVPDACVLGNDIGYACRNDKRTTLVNATNSGAVRLICARHVIGDIWRHADEFATRYGVTREVLLTRFCAEYLPLLRVVRDVPGGWFGRNEAARIRALGDRDDVPSVRLAVALGACYLSEDKPALRAVYGDAVDFERHHAWVELLKAGGDAGELEQWLIGGTVLLTLAGYPGVAGARRLSRACSPLGSAVLLTASVGAAWYLTAPDTRFKLRRRLVTAGRWVGQVLAAYMAAMERFNAAAAPTPDWESLAVTRHPMAVLKRASLFTLSRAPASHLSAVEIRRDLPYGLTVPTSEAKVRAALRAMEPGCVNQPYQGRFQVGRCALPRRAVPGQHVSSPPDCGPVHIAPDR